jgi:hypothetical protein
LWAVDSIRNKDNDEIYEHLRISKSDAGINKWCDWQYYPVGMAAHPTLTGGKSVDFLAWVVYFFMPDVSKRVMELDNRRLYKKGILFAKMTADDLAYLFLLLENNINHWILVSQKLDAMKEDGEERGDKRQWRQTKKEIGGYEFSLGSGISGKEGTARFYSLRKFFWQHYYRNDEESAAVSAANRSALIKAILEVMKSDKRNKTTTESSSARKRKEPPPLDTNSIDYQMMMDGWNNNSNHLLVHAPDQVAV